MISNRVIAEYEDGTLQREFMYGNGYNEVLAMFLRIYEGTPAVGMPFWSLRMHGSVKARTPAMTRPMTTTAMAKSIWRILRTGLRSGICRQAPKPTGITYPMH